MEKIQVSLKSEKNKEQHTFFIISRSIDLRMRYVSDKHYTENQNILCSITFL